MKDNLNIEVYLEQINGTGEVVDKFLIAKFYNMNWAKDFMDFEKTNLNYGCESEMFRISYKEISK